MSRADTGLAITPMQVSVAGRDGMGWVIARSHRNRRARLQFQTPTSARFEGTAIRG
jgi:hypothetical protein